MNTFHFLVQSRSFYFVEIQGNIHLGEYNLTGHVPCEPYSVIFGDEDNPKYRIDDDVDTGSKNGFPEQTIAAVDRSSTSLGAIREHTFHL